MNPKKYLSVPQVAKILGISRIAVFKRVQKGQIKAIRIGRQYAIPVQSLNNLLGRNLTESEKKQIEKTVRRAFDEYGETLRLLGRE